MQLLQPRLASGISPSTGIGVKIDRWENIREEFGRKPFEIRPVFHFKPTPEMIAFAKQNNFFVKFKIRNTDTYDGEIWGKLF